MRELTTCNKLVNNILEESFEERGRLESLDVHTVEMAGNLFEK